MIKQLVRYQTQISIWFIIVFGALFRFTNLNWDSGGRLHPDEALIINGALSIRWFTNLFPGFHDYNGFSVYLLKLFSFGTQSPITLTLIGRMLSASISTFTIFVLFQFGKKLWNEKIGLLAALFFAFTPLSIQLAHFYTTESIMILLLTLLGYTCAIYNNSHTSKSILLMGIESGLLIATKNTGYLFLSIPFLTIFLHKKEIRPFLFYMSIVIATFFLSSPYSFLDLHGYLTRSGYLADVVSGKLLMDWTIQFQKTNGTFWIKNILFAFGPIIVFGFIGAIVHLLPQKKGSRFALQIIALWAVGFFAFLACTYLKFIRYSAPLLPFMALFSASTLWGIRKSSVGKIILSLAIFAQIIWGFMFFHVYASPHTSLVARDWISQYLPAHSVIMREEWNNAIHFDTPPLLGKQYGFISINLYTQPDTIEKYQNLISSLHTVDYFISESPKVKNTIQRLSLTYPYTALFYKNLDNGSLGFKHIITFSSYPQFGGIAIHDELSEETFTVFDHPTIKIYKNTKK